MIRNRKKHAAEVDDQDEVTAEAEKPTEDRRTFGHVTAGLHADADAKRQVTAQNRSAIAAGDAALAAEKQRLDAEHAEQTRILAATADSAERDARGLEERARLMNQADSIRDQADAAEQSAQDLAAESEQVAAEHARIGKQLASFRSHRQTVETDLADARTAKNADKMTEARNRLASFEEMITDTERDERRVQGALERIGDEDEGQLADVLARARALRAELYRVLCQLVEGKDQPGHDEAVWARDAEAERAAVELGRVRDRLAASLAGVGPLADRLKADRVELARRDDIPAPMRTTTSLVAIREQIEAVEGYVERLGAVVSSVQAILEQIGAAGPADVERMTVLARNQRAHVRYLLDHAPAPLPPDDLGDPFGNLAATLRETADAEPEPGPGPQRVIRVRN